MLHYLETVEISHREYEQSRFQVQYVIRPQTEELHDYRGYAGQIISGTYAKGDEVIIYPQEQKTRISKIESAGEEIEQAFAHQPVVLHIEDDIDISRGDFFIKADETQPLINNDVEALVCWLDKRELSEGSKCLLQHRSRILKTIVKEIEYKIDVNTLEQVPADGTLKLNEIVKIRFRTASPVIYDDFKENETMGSAILIDETSNATVGALMMMR